MSELSDVSSVAGGLDAAVARLHHVLRRAATDGQARLPAAQAELLRTVENHPAISVSEAAARLRIAANTVSTLVGSLSAAGLLTRTRDPANRRIVHLDLTDEARDWLRRYEARRRALLAEAMAGLDAGALADLARAVEHLRRLEELLGSVKH